MYSEKGDAWPKALKHNYEKYGYTRRALRHKHHGIWQPDLFLFGLAHGHLLFETRAGQLVRLPVEWKLEKILKGAVI